MNLDRSSVGFCLFCLDFMRPRWLAVLIELSPLEEPASLLTWYVVRMTHPHISPPTIFLPRSTSQDRRNATLAFRRILRVQIIFIEPIRDVQPLVLRQWVWIDSLCRRNRMFPLLLHFSMHNQERVVREMDGYLTLGVR